jgi:membrane associated rhomboid family serine protease
MIPVSTDAPVYHFPYATISMIVVNVLFFFVFCRNPAAFEGVALEAPDGRVFYSEAELESALMELEDRREMQQFRDNLRIIHYKSWARQLTVEFGEVKPWQWLTNNFMHAGPVHLISNMIFLWAFGLVVEGKVGWLRFAALYLGIGITYGFVLQVGSLPFGIESFALGASAAIFGLLALCVAWAPANEFSICWIMFGFAGVSDVSIVMYGFMFVAKEVFILSLLGFQMSSEMLHLIGFMVAFPVGLWMVRFGFVDCEGWDLFSYLKGTLGSESKVGKDKIRAREKKADAKQVEVYRKANLLTDPVDTGRKLQLQVEQAITDGDIDLAIMLQHRITTSNPAVTWRQIDLYRVIQAYLKAKNYNAAIPMMEQHIESFDEQRFTLQVLLLKIWLQDNRPRKAMRYMQGLNLAFFSAEQKQQMQQLANHAKKLIVTGVIEVE